MAKRIMQFRYYGDNHSDNQPKNTVKQDFISARESGRGGVFHNYLPFTKLGIQTLPGTRFYLNSNPEGPIIIGSTGIYELELEGISEIDNLYFDLKSLELIESNPNAYLIIDVVYYN